MIVTLVEGVAGFDFLEGADHTVELVAQRNKQSPWLVQISTKELLDKLGRRCEIIEDDCHEDHYLWNFTEHEYNVVLES